MGIGRSSALFRYRIQRERLSRLDVDRNWLAVDGHKAFRVWIKVAERNRWDVVHPGFAWTNGSGKNLAVVLHKTSERFIGHLEVCRKLRKLGEWRRLHQFHRAIA